MRICRAQVIHLRVPIEVPVRTSFGVMDARHAVLLVIEDEQGRQGIGESWVNFPAWAARERVAAFEEGYLPHLRGKDVENIPEFIRRMFQAFRGPALQANAVGPLLQALCAVELALWDLRGKIENRPLCRLWFDNPAIFVEVYGSGINHPLPFAQIDDLHTRGVRLFKLKMGLGQEQDLRSLSDLSSHLRGRAQIAIDVNRNWSLKEAKAWMPRLRDMSIQWLEEPLQPEDEPQTNSLRGLGVTITGGENLNFDLEMQNPPREPAGGVSAASFDILQPDATKNCPSHLFPELIRQAHHHGQRVYPHFLGSGPGLAASIHLAAGCGQTLMEWDINTNPLRTELMKPAFDIRDGRIELPDAPGLGWQLDPAAIERFLVR